MDDLKVGDYVVWCYPGKEPMEREGYGIIDLIVYDTPGHVRDDGVLVRWDSEGPNPRSTYHSKKYLVVVCPYCKRKLADHVRCEAGYRCLFGSNTWKP